jgi:hypothetical protein
MHGLELDPLYCDVVIRRWQSYTGHARRHGRYEVLGGARGLCGRPSRHTRQSRTIRGTAN